MKVVYILDQVRALENEMLLRIRRQGLDITPRILIVSVFMLSSGQSTYFAAPNPQPPFFCDLNVILFYAISPR